MTRAVASAEWANMRDRSSTLGQLTLTSSAAMQRAGAPCSPPRRPAPAARAYSATVRPQMLTTTRAPAAASAGRSSAAHAARPGPCSPTLLSMPAPTSCTRGCRVARPGLGRERLHHDRAERGQVAVVGELGAVARRPRRRHDRVRQVEGPDPGRASACLAWPRVGQGQAHCDRPVRLAVAGCRSCSARTCERVRPRVGDAGRRGPGRRQRW